MNENNKVVDLSKLKIQKPKLSTIRLNNKHFNQGFHFKSISKDKINFLIEYTNNDSLASENKSQSTATDSPLFIQETTKELNMSEISNQGESIKYLNDFANAVLSQDKANYIHNLRHCLNFELYNQHSLFIQSNLNFYDNMLEYFDSIILGLPPKDSSFSILADWFEATRNEQFYDVTNSNVFSDPLSSCIAKEYIMLELISVNLHLLILNKVQDFMCPLIVKFFSQIRILFNLFKYNYTYMCRIGLSLQVFSSIFKLVEIKGELDMAHVNSNNKDIKKAIKCLFKLIKEQMILDESESFCLKHLKYLFYNFQKEYYFDLKLYSYNVYLFSGVFLSPESELERSYPISKVNDNREDAPALSQGNRFSCEVLVPFLNQPDPTKSYYLILDLDETLVHSISVIYLNSYIYFRGLKRIM